jgi:RNA polymerase sigma factor (sigma-70 family)
MKADEGTIRKWTPLVRFVISTYFGWIQGDSGFPGGSRRSIDYDDLFQEGVVALFDAIAAYDPNHHSNTTFKTYAHKVIRRHLVSYVGENSTHMHIGRPGRIMNVGSDELKNDLKNAMSYRLFSEFKYVLNPIDESSVIEDAAQRIEKKDFVEHCQKVMQEVLTFEEQDVVKMKCEGMSLIAISKAMNCSYETARRMYRTAIIQCRIALIHEGEELL